MNTEYVTWAGGTKRVNWPAFGTIVRLRRYAEGNVYRDDQRVNDLVVVGEVVESPAHGSNYLVVAISEMTGSAASKYAESGDYHFDPTDSEAWTISRDRVTLRSGEFWRWTIEHVSNPAPPTPEGPGWSLTTDGNAAMDRWATQQTCRHCGHTGLRIDWRLEAREVGSFSLAGAQMKVSAQRWPYAVCLGCGHESRGERG